MIVSSGLRLGAILAASAAASAAVAAPPVRGKAAAVMVDAAPKLDGTLDDPLWQKCPPLVLGACGTGEPLEPATEARVLFGPTTLYVAVSCAEPDTAGLAARIRDRDGEVWADDCVEIHVSGDSRVGDHQFIVNPAGTLYDARDKDAAWNSTARVAAAVADGQRWTATLAIPLAEVGGFVGENQSWGLNVNRVRSRGGVWSWAVLTTCDFHQRGEFGVVTGVNVPRRDDGVTREATPLPTGVQVLYRETFDGGNPRLSGGQIEEGVGPGGRSRVYRGGDKELGLSLGIPQVQGVKMALSYRCAPDVHGVVVAGSGKPVNPTRPGLVKVVGRGLEVAQQRCSVDADRAGTTTDAGFGFYRFTRRYGHCQQGNMPPTPGAEWAVASFGVDSMFSNDSHSPAPPSQQYNYFSIRLNRHGEVSKNPFLELGYLVVWRGVSEPPAAPSAFAAERQGEQVHLQWKPAEDDLMVAYYELLRQEGEEWKPVTVCTMTALDLPADRLAAGTYALRAVDVDEQRSAPSATVQVP
jgi:hypothetical protein